MIERVQPILLLGGQSAHSGVAMGPPWARYISDRLSVSDAALSNLARFGFERSECRLIVDYGSSDVGQVEGLGASAFSDPRPDRGTAGLLRDHIDSHQIDHGIEWILILDGLASPAIDLASMLQGSSSGKSVILGVSELGRYCGACLFPRVLLSDVASVGFVDLKEQFLPRALELGHSIQAKRVASRALAVRSREGWLATVTAWARFASVDGLDSGACNNEGTRTVGDCVIRPSAECDGAVLVSSVVLDDAVVGEGAVVARSLIGPGVRVEPGAVVVDAVLPGRDDRLVVPRIEDGTRDVSS